jgi:hypothetical protein
MSLFKMDHSQSQKGDVVTGLVAVQLGVGKECFSALKGERGMMTVDFEQAELRCAVGPDVPWGRVVVVHVN